MKNTTGFLNYHIITALGIIFQLIVADFIIAEDNGSWTLFKGYGIITDYVIQDNYLWCTRADGIGRWNLDDGSYENFDDVTQDIWTLVQISPDGSLWFSTLSYETGSKLRYYGETWTEYTFEDTGFYLASKMTHFDLDGNAWCANQTGIYKFDGTSWNNMIDYKVFGTPTSEPIMGEDGKVWIGYFFDGDLSSGIAYFENGTWTKFPFGLIGYRITSITIDAGGNFWCNYEVYFDDKMPCYDRLCRFDGETWKYFTVDDGLFDDCDNKIIIAPDGTIWCVSIWDVIAKFNGENWTTYTPDTENSNIFTSIAVGMDGKVWAGYDEKVYRFNGVEWKTYTSEDGLGVGIIQDIDISQTGDVWVGTSSRDLNQCAVSVFKSNTWQSYSFNSNLTWKTNSMVIDSRNVIWIGVNDGVLRFDPKTSAVETSPKPLEFDIIGNYPNPFNHVTTIRYTIPCESVVTVYIYNIMGQKIRDILCENVVAGNQNVYWDGTDNNGLPVSTGVYLYRIETGEHHKSGRMMFLK